MARKKAPQKPSKKSVLGDHKKAGKKLIPPVLLIKNLDFSVSYIKHILPEIMWLAVLNDKLGVNRTAKFIDWLCSTIKDEFDLPTWFMITSYFAALDCEKRNTIRKLIRKSEFNQEFKNALYVFSIFYPKFPLAVRPSKNREIQAQELEDYKTLLAKHYNKFSKEATFTQAQVFFGGLISGKMHVAPHLSLAKFENIFQFPNTEESKKIASGIRINILVGLGMCYQSEPSDWPSYFWNQGFKIEPLREPLSVHSVEYYEE